MIPSTPMKIQTTGPYAGWWTFLERRGGEVVRVYMRVDKDGNFQKETEPLKKSPPKS